MMKARFNITIGILFILAGALLGSGYIIQFIKNSNYAHSTPQFVTIKQTAPIPAAALPTHVSVPSTGMSVGVDPGYYDASTQTWTLSDTKAYFATVTTPPNSIEGNTYIYGHNRASVFSALNKATIGADAVVTTAANKTFTYQLVSIKDAQPNDLSLLLNYQGKPILTLQTCAGLWDQYRRLFVFNFVSET
jgi:LPXTG-site transpeptidase (sortase) family protein